MIELAPLFVNPVSRIAEGDVSLGSIFTQLNAAHIILAVQKGYINVVERESSPGTKRSFLELTEEGKRWYEEGKKARSETSKQSASSRPSSPNDTRHDDGNSDIDNRPGEAGSSDRQSVGTEREDFSAGRGLLSGSEYLTFGKLRVGDQFKLLMASGSSYRPVFRKLNDAEEDNAEIVDVKGRRRLCQFPADSGVLLVPTASS